MVKRFSNERLREWAESLLHEENPLGYSLLGYAEEWKLEKDQLRAENLRLLEQTCLICNMLERQDCSQEKAGFREENKELRTALTDLVFQCEQHPHIQTDRAKAVLERRNHGM